MQRYSPAIHHYADTPGPAMREDSESGDWYHRDDVDAMQLSPAQAQARDEMLAYIGRLEARVAELEKNSARYQWLKDTDPTGVCCIAWRKWAAVKFNVCDKAVDAAMAQSLMDTGVGK